MAWSSSLSTPISCAIFSEKYRLFSGIKSPSGSRCLLFNLLCLNPAVLAIACNLSHCVARTRSLLALCSTVGVLLSLACCRGKSLLRVEGRSVTGWNCRFTFWEYLLCPTSSYQTLPSLCECVSLGFILSSLPFSLLLSSALHSSIHVISLLIILSSLVRSLSRFSLNSFRLFTFLPLGFPTVRANRDCLRLLEYKTNGLSFPPLSNLSNSLLLTICARPLSLRSSGSIQ